MNTMKKTALLAAAVAAVAMPATAANLLAHYPLDSYYTLSGVPRTPNMVAGWGDAIVNYSGGVPYQSTFLGTGKIGGSWEENGAAASLRFGNMDPFSYTGSFTYALWVYDPFSTTINQQTFLLSKQNANTSHYFRAVLRSGATPSTDDMQIGAYSGALQDRAATGFATDPSQRWVHIAVTGSKVGSTATWQVYADGIPLTMPNNTTTLNSSFAGQLMTAGAFSTQVAQGYPGVQLDEIRFYDGVLSQSEILTLIPEPSAFAMIAVGGLMLLIRRSRQ